MSNKYAHLLNETINSGKRNYKSYLRAEIKKLDCGSQNRYIQKHVVRLKRICGKPTNFHKYGDIIYIDVDDNRISDNR